MGIQGLLPLLKSAQEPVHISDFSGQTLGIDAYVWLHRGAFSCSQDLCLNRPNQRYGYVSEISLLKFTFFC